MKKNYLFFPLPSHDFFIILFDILFQQSDFSVALILLFIALIFYLFYQSTSYFHAFSFMVAMAIIVC